jgi:hypothetical protein
VNPDTEQVGYHAQRVTKEEAARAEALVRRMCPDPEPVLAALGLIEAPAPQPPVEYCRNGHQRTPENTGWRRPPGITPRPYCKTCEQERLAARKPPKDPPTHCRNGHEYTAENTLTRVKEGRDTRACRACEKARKQRDRERVRGETEQ